MKVLVAVSVFLLKFLIGIGDAVLYLVQFFIDLISSIISLLVYVVQIIGRFIGYVVRGIIDTVLFPFRFTRKLFTQKRPKTLYKNAMPAYVRFEKKNQKAPQKVKEKIKIKKTVKKVVIHASRPITKFKFFAIGVLFSCLFVFIPVLFYIFLQDLPNPKELTGGQIAQTTKIYDRNHTLLYQIYANQNRTIIPLSQIPKNVKLATIAIEDKDFYSHPGFNIQAIIRSAIQNTKGEGIQGGSTLTQQLIKSALLTPERSFTRKIKEVILAFWTERIYSKDQILELYLNQIPYGGTAWGIEAASENYFGSDASDLDLAESAFLAGVARAPSTYSPYVPNNTLWKTRQKEVLDRMQALHYITSDQENAALDEQLIFKPPQIPIHAPHFVLYVKDLLINKYGLPAVEKGGLNVVTTLDLPLQEKAEQIVKEEVDNDANLNLTNGAALITSPKTGDILAMVGSKDYYDPNGGNVNVTTSLRQPGSSIKVVTYSAALSHGFTPATIIDDAPVTFAWNPPYTPVNYDGRFHGKVTLRQALANSFNIPAVKALAQIGIPTMVNLAREMGIKSWGPNDTYGLGVTLGSNDVTMVDMATVFGTLANSGQEVDLNPILSVTDSKGNVIEQKQVFPTRVLDEGVSFIVSNILMDNNARALEFGLNSPLNIPGVSVKTGTSDEKRDNWTIGYTPQNVVAVWVGNNDNSPMNPALASGITGAAPIWNKLMKGLLGGNATASAQVPSDIVSRQCMGHTEYFLRGTENSVNCTPITTPTPTPKP